MINVRDGLIMRSLSTYDAQGSYALIDSNRSYLRTWLPWIDGTNSPAVVERVILSWERSRENGSDTVLGIFEEGEYVGNIGLHDINRESMSGMIGYWLAQNRQNRGIMTDCVRALTTFGFDELGLNRIYIHCGVKNARSRAVPERLGFVQEGILQNGECLYGNYHDLIVYAALKQDWPKGSI